MLDPITHVLFSSLSAIWLLLVVVLLFRALLVSYGDNEAFPLIGDSSMDCASTPTPNHLIRKASSLDSQTWLTCQISLLFYLLACLLVAWVLRVLLVSFTRKRLSR